ncbi:hypothetical protein Tco_1437551 [Tanacetum coccineum]
MADLLQDNLALGERLDKHGTRLYNLENLDIPHKVSQAVDEIVTDVVDWAMQAPLRARFRDLPSIDLKEILQQRKLVKSDERDVNAPRSPLGHHITAPLHLLKTTILVNLVLQELQVLLSCCHLHLLHRLVHLDLLCNRAVKLRVHPRIQPQLNNLWLGPHLILDMSQLVETDIQEKEQKESQKQTNPSSKWKGQSQKSAK